MRGSVLAVLVSLTLHPLLDGLRFPSLPAGLSCCSHWHCTRRQSWAAGKLFPSQTLAIIEIEPKWNTTGSPTHLIGPRDRKPGVGSDRGFGNKRTGSRNSPRHRKTDMQT